MDERLALPCPQAGTARGAQDDLTALIRAAQDDPVAFAALYERFARRVYAYMRARAPVAEEAHDLTQQVFLQALRALPRYRGSGGEFAGWLFRIARNTASNARSRRRPTVALHLMPESRQPQAAGDPEAEALRHEDSARLRAVLAALPAEKRELLALRFAAGLTVGEMAAVIGKGEAALRKQLSRTLQTLQERYDERP